MKILGTRLQRLFILTTLGVLLAFLIYVRLPLDRGIFSIHADVSVKITDRHGIVLREVLSAEGGRSSWLTYEQIPATVVQAVLSTEDKRFFAHDGVDWLAFGRAMIQNLASRQVVSGASTLTQQVIKNRFGLPRTISGKLREIILAMRLEHTLSKQEIFEQYINRVEFSNLAFGIEAAANVYFQKPAAHLSLAESVFLAGLIQAPSRLNPYRYPERAQERQQMLLERLFAQQQIDEQTYQIAQNEALRLAPKNANFKAPHFCDMVLQFSSLSDRTDDRSLEATINKLTPQPLLLQREGEKTRSGETAVLPFSLQERGPGGEFFQNSTTLSPRGGAGGRFSGEIRTTLDYYLQAAVEEIVTTRVEELKDYNVTNAAVLVLDNRSGGVLAYVGSKDFFDESIAGQVDGVLALRQPGSALKPFTYQLALERSYTTATLLPDIQEYPAAPRSFMPENYDRKFHGPVRLRQALACSYNVPVVRVLEKIGVATLYDRLHAYGMTSLKELPSFYGPGLTLGNGEITLLELTRAYSILARRGQDFQVQYLNLSPNVSPKATNSPPGRGQGWVAESGGTHVINDPPLPLPGGDFRGSAARIPYLSVPLEGAGARSHIPMNRQLFSPLSSYLITHILADRQAAVPAFGAETPLRLPFVTAVKTGTSKDYRDNWTVGYTPDYTVGVWVGNFDAAAMQRVSGISGAAPIYRDVMLHLYRSYDPPSVLADPPPELTHAQICPVSGKLVNEDCPHAIDEIFLKGTEPTETCDMHQAYWVDSRNDLLTEPDAPYAVQKVFIHFPPLYQSWARKMGYPDPPTRYSPLLARNDDPAASAPPQIRIVRPNHGDVYAIDPVLRREFQTIQLSAVVPPDITQVTWYVDGEPWEDVEAPFQADWPITAGTHRLYVEGLREGDIVRSQEITVYVIE